MQGTTGTFAINGTEFLLPPSEHDWVERGVIGDTGLGRPVYPAVREYEMRWDLMPMDAYSQLENFYLSVESSGTAVIDLPKFATSPYQYFSYSGVTMQEPKPGKFFVDHVSDVVLVVQRIRTK